MIYVIVNENFLIMTLTKLDKIAYVNYKKIY